MILNHFTNWIYRLTITFTLHGHFWTLYLILESLWSTTPNWIMLAQLWERIANAHGTGPSDFNKLQAAWAWEPLFWTLSLKHGQRLDINSVSNHSRINQNRSILASRDSQNHTWDWVVDNAFGEEDRAQGGNGVPYVRPEPKQSWEVLEMSCFCVSENSWKHNVTLPFK